MGKKVIFENLGRIRYKEAWDYQEKLFQEVIRDKKEQIAEKKQYLLFCEHEHVFTLGKSGNQHNLLIAENLCQSRNIDLHAIDRGETLPTMDRVSWSFIRSSIWRIFR